jgi:hypothetical protein
MQCANPQFQKLAALQELQQFKQWVNWINDPLAKNLPEGEQWKEHKSPVQANESGEVVAPAKSNTPSTWSSYDAVFAAAAKNPKLGIGFVLANGVCGQDFDHVIDSGVTEPWVLAEISKLNTYTEISPSGTGYHCLGKANLPGGKNPDHNRVETYDSGRYFTFTGNHVPGTPEFINENQAAASSFYTRIADLDLGRPKPTKKDKNGTIVSCTNFDLFTDALRNHSGSVESLINDDTVQIEVGEGGRHGFLTRAIGYLWDGKRTKDELNTLGSSIAERFCCSGGREITANEIGDLVSYCMERDPNQSQKESPLQAQKKRLIGVPWFTSVDDFLVEKISPKRSLITDMAGNPILTSSMLAELYAFRGVGKSLFLLAFIHLLIFGGEFLGYKSTGGFKVLLCDGELPPQDLQDRLQELVGVSHGLFTMMDTSHLPGHVFPSMSDPDYQQEFIRQVDELKPDVVIFDTLTACFKFDTNDTDKWMVVNQFFTDLRNKEYCMVLSHHAGKNGTQRGRTDGDDDLDLVLKLDMPSGHEPGMGLEFVVTYEKYRPKVKEGTRVIGFQAKLVLGKWELVIDSEKQNIIKALTDGQTYKWIRENLPGVNNTKINNVVKFMKATGMAIPPPKPKKKADKAEKGGGK